MFDPVQVRECVKSKRKYHIIVISPQTGITVRPLSSRNPVRRMLELIEDRGWSDEVYLVRTKDLEVLTFIPPLIPQH